MRFSMTLVFICITLFSGAQTENCWPNSRGNAQLLGTTTVDFPQQVELKWTFDADGIFKSAPVICNEKIVVGSTNGTLYCLNMKGDSIWGFVTENAIEAPALIDQGVVYFGNLTGMLYALDLETGEKLWEYKTDNQIMGSPTLYKTADRSILAVGSYDYYLHGVDAKTGLGLWKYESDNFLNSAPALNENIAVFGGCDGYMHLVDLNNGQSTGKVEIATYVASSPAIANNRAYIGDYDGGFTCIDLNAKAIKWRFQNPNNDLPFIASPSLVENKILIGSRDKFMYCLSATDGEIIWKKNTGMRIDASTIANKTQVLLINMRGDLILMNHNDGSIAWNYKLGATAINAPAVIANHIFIAGSDGNVYCLSEK